MKKILLSTFVIATISLSACHERIAEFDNTLPAVQSGNATSVPLAGDSADIGNAVIQPASVPAQTNGAKNTVALNPEHGQPGHRCEIAVGAPLNSAPAAAAATKMSLPTPQPIVPGSSVTLNPPHGQPGHDCSIQVGQPLKG
jgi:hypothetical protein